MTNNGNSVEAKETEWARLPASAVQALYHAATGKTENLSKQFEKKAIVQKNDIDQLYFKVMQQIEHYSTIADPTITVNVSFRNSESQQFSSWERYKLFDYGRAEIVSELIVKFEFLIKLPASQGAQRYIISVTVDSQLPTYEENDENATPWQFTRMFFPNGYPSVAASIDFVDYLCAKNFLQTIEDWVRNLESIPKSRWRAVLAKMSLPWPYVFGHVANLGLAAFIGMYTYLKVDTFTAPAVAYLGAVAIVLWSLSTIFCRLLGERFSDIVSRGFLPPAIVLTEGDRRSIAKAREQANGAPLKSIIYAFSLLIALLINVASSFLYAWITK